MGSPQAVPAEQQPPQPRQSALSPLRDPRVATMRGGAGASAAGSVTSRGSAGFGGRAFWQALRSTTLEKEASTCPEQLPKIWNPDWCILVV